MDIRTYSGVYNFTGVARGSLPEGLEKGLPRRPSEDDIFALADAPSASIDTSTLKSEAISGYTMIAVRLKDHAAADGGPGTAGGAGVRGQDGPLGRGIGILRADLLRPAGLHLLRHRPHLPGRGLHLHQHPHHQHHRAHGRDRHHAGSGREKSFIRGIFLSETLFLNVAASLVGIVVGLALVLAPRPLGPAASGYRVPVPHRRGTAADGSEPHAVRHRSRDRHRRLDPCHDRRPSGSPRASRPSRR